MVAFEFFGFEVYWYGIFYLISFLFGYYFLVFLKNKKLFSNYKNFQNLLNKGIEDLMIAIILGTLIGGRLAYVFIYNFSYYINNPIEIFFVRDGGMGFIGGVIGVLFGLLYIKKIYNLSLKEFFLVIDIIVLILPFGIMLGRIGNFLNQELYGDPIDKYSENIKSFFYSFNLVHTYESIDSKPRINTNFLESIFEGFIIFIINQFIFWKSYLKNNLKPGFVSALFLIFYGVVRFIVEFFREYDSSEFIGLLTKTQYFMILFIVLGFLLIYKINLNKKNCGKK